MKGLVGYGRYDDAPKLVGCPRAHSDMTPCVARDGQCACDDNGLCVGCGENPVDLLVALVRAVSKISQRDEARAEVERLRAERDEAMEITGLSNHPGEEGM